jgi:FHA domain-containing protein
VGAAGTWTAVVTADRAYYDHVRAADAADDATMTFPVYVPERRFPLAGTEVRIGRRSSRSPRQPDIDLTGPPADPGVSRQHAELRQAPDGAWSVIDLGSDNGIQVNGNDVPRHRRPGPPLAPPRHRDRVRLREPPLHPQPVQRLAAEPEDVGRLVDEQIPRILVPVIGVPPSPPDPVNPAITVGVEQPPSELSRG